LQAEEHAFCIDAMDAVPVGLGDVHYIRAAGHACVVQQNVDLTELLDCCPNHAIDLLQIADIGLHCQRFALCGHDGFGGCFGALTVNIGNHDVRTGFRQGKRGGLADALRRAGDQRDLVVQIHGTPSRAISGQSSDDSLRRPACGRMPAETCCCGSMTDR
jgi:hypothetical protein